MQKLALLKEQARLNAIKEKLDQRLSKKEQEIAREKQ
jgi:hypothetical protein